MKPHPVVISLLTKVEDVIPKWKIVPTKDVIDSAFKDPIKREQVSLLIYHVTMIRFKFINVKNYLKNLQVICFPLHFLADSREQIDIPREAQT